MHHLAQVLSPVTCHPCSCAFLLEFVFLLFFFDLSFPVFFSFHLLHCELHTELDNLIAMQKTCASSRTRRVTTPTTSTPPSQVMSPTTWPSASSGTPRVPSPTLHRHRTWTLTTLHSASCSPRHTPRTSRLLRSRRRVSQSVVVVCCVR